MIGVFVTFRYPQDFDERALREIAATARTRFEGMAGLRSKAFTVNAEARQAKNFYVWDSDEAARAFFSVETLDRIAAIYRARPDVEFVHVAALVENDR